MIASNGRQPGSAANGDSCTTGAAKPGSRPGAPHTHPLEPVIAQLTMLRDFALHYVEAQKDAVTSSVRRALLKTVLGLLAALVGATLLVTCTVMLAVGLAQLVSMAAGGREWVGNLVVGGGVLLVVGAATAIYISRALSAARKRTIDKYELRHTAQRAKYGTDVTERAAV